MMLLTSWRVSCGAADEMTLKCRLISSSEIFKIIYVTMPSLVDSV